ncbi:MAG: restriction endonuclease [Shewanella sp.]
MIELATIEDFKKHLVSLHPMEVEKLVFDILKSSEKFSDVLLNPVINDRQIDITLTEKGDNPIAERSFWAVEIKSYRSLVSVNVIDAFYGKLLDIQRAKPNSKLLIISTSGYTKAAIEKAKRTGIYLWGANELYSLHCNIPFQMSASEPSESSQNSELAIKVEAFKNALIGIEPGKANWSKYQSLVVDILEFLLCPPLEPPKVEIADSDQRNRRDIIFENASSDGFWLRVRDIYQGHYIVVDAKNYTKPLSKRPVLDISHYLKPYGCGMFAIITSRQGYGTAGSHAAKEQWIGNKKLIVSLADVDLLKMLDLKKEGVPPEDVIKDQISNFRMAL